MFPSLPKIFTLRRRGVPAGGEGFSLIELLVVVAILAVLAAITIPTFLNQKQRAAEGVTRSDVRSVGTDVAGLFAGKVSSVTGGDGSVSPQLVVDGQTVQKNSASVYADVNGNWCVSKIAQSGKMFAMSSTNRSVYEASGPCSSASSNPAAVTAGFDDACPF